MKKKLWSMVLIGTLMVSTGILASASGGDEFEAQIEVGVAAPDEEDLETVPPIPEPDPDEDGGTGHVGFLTIDWVSPLRFPDIVIGESQTVRADNENPFVQVTDQRASGAGWTLQVGTEGFFSGTTPLRGAELTFISDRVGHQEGNVSTPPIATNEFTISANHGAAYVMVAASGSGLGSWYNMFEEVTLLVPEGQTAGEYSAWINWTLLDVPPAN